ncbi:MAG: tetratricopeptide (TPR) repeat protein [Candidatus Azotimanducaceae bacterium]|jgi:tetratricopeptide (TPR) repeat protein
MSISAEQLSMNGRQAMRYGDWKVVNACAMELMRILPNNPEGYFLKGKCEKADKQVINAIKSFEKALEIDENRHDAAIELASQYVMSLRNKETIVLLEQYKEHLSNSPRYLDMAGTIYTDIGMANRALPFYRKAVGLQPDIELFNANLAACLVFAGEIEEAKGIYQSLLEKHPNHQRNHYHLARLDRAKDDGHIKKMKSVLENTQLAPSMNVFIHYALAKELEDLGRWDESYQHYELAGDGATSVANYDIEQDEILLEKITEVCSEEWLNESTEIKTDITDKTPVFVLGLPRTGTTLTERILSSHSQIESIGETKYMESILRTQSAVPSLEKMIPQMIDSLRSKDIGEIANNYLNSVNYLCGDKPMFIEKLPYNFLYIGFIAKAYPDARIIHLKRNPMDSCFAIYKQPFSWAYKFSYNLETLARYYIAHDKLSAHWKALLGDRIIEIEYEELVGDQENQTRILLDKLGLDFEEACLNFDQNQSASMTASSVQVREKIHSRSVHRWKRFESQLQPLKNALLAAGISVD